MKQIKAWIKNIALAIMMVFVLAVVAVGTIPIAIWSVLKSFSITYERGKFEFGLSLWDNDREHSLADPLAFLGIPAAVVQYYLTGSETTALLTFAAFMALEVVKLATESWHETTSWIDRRASQSRHA